jgi:maltose O-acetyltransferase
VGASCFFGLYNVVMGPVDMGDGVSTGPFVSILGPRHALYEYDQSEGKSTRIGNNVWISAGAIIHFGVEIGDNAVIAPGAVVTKDVPPDAYFAGNPARDITRMSSLGELMARRSAAAGAGAAGGDKA